MAKLLAADAAPPLPEVCDGMEEVRALLASYRLEQYAEAFDEQGYDDLPFLRMQSKERLEALLKDGIGMKPGQCVRLERTSAPCCGKERC